jgi:hypothetical protein
MRHPKKTKYGDYATWIKFEVFSNYHVRLVFSNDLAKSAKGRLGHMPADHAADAFVYHPTDGAQSYMFLPMHAGEGTIAHEAWHVVHKIFGYVGAEMDNENVAYHLGWLIKEIYDFKKAVKSSRRIDDKHSGTSSKKCS